MSTTRRRFSAEEKVTILRRHLLDKVPVSDLCEEHRAHPNVLYRWRKGFFENGAAALLLSLCAAAASAQGGQDGPKPEYVLTPLRIVSVASAGNVTPGVHGLGHAAASIGQFKGVCNTYVQFQLPNLPPGRAVTLGRLKLYADYVSSRKYPPYAWAAIVAGELPKDLKGDAQPPIIELTQTRSVKVEERGPFTKRRSSSRFRTPRRNGSGARRKSVWTCTGSRS